VYFDSNFAAAALCLYYPGESDEFIQLQIHRGFSRMSTDSTTQIT
jgi:hypothetical protein